MHRVPMFPDPGDTFTAPDLPLVAAPVDIVTPPLEPALAAPEEKTRVPLTPFDPEAELRTTTPPLLFAVAEPELTDTTPPVAPELRPPLKARGAGESSVAPTASDILPLWLLSEAPVTITAAPEEPAVEDPDTN